jgi:hypothetical protein
MTPPLKSKQHAQSGYELFAKSLFVSGYFAGNIAQPDESAVMSARFGRIFFFCFPMIAA